MESPMHSRCRARKAFTMMEMLITVLLVMGIFGLVADLLTGAYQVARVQRQKTEAAEAGQLALQRILCELREAARIDITTPQQITLFKFNAARTLDCQNLDRRYAHSLRIRYFLDADSTLLREVEEFENASPGSRVTHVVAEGIQGLGASLEPNTGNIQVELTVNLRNRLRVLSSEVTPLAVVL